VLPSGYRRTVSNNYIDERGVDMFDGLMELFQSCKDCNRDSREAMISERLPDTFQYLLKLPLTMAAFGARLRIVIRLLGSLAIWTIIPRTTIDLGPAATSTDTVEIVG
jgi:hypothetical protein